MLASMFDIRSLGGGLALCGSDLRFKARLVRGSAQTFTVGRPTDDLLDGGRDRDDWGFLAIHLCFRVRRLRGF